jgi:hypothetical protein
LFVVFIQGDCIMPDPSPSPDNHGKEPFVAPRDKPPTTPDPDNHGKAPFKKPTEDGVKPHDDNHGKEPF